ncbi:MAG: hypothetical protein GMKNLPBB_02129 [Myxococcota bacterium]|nr:hypothetical protein [Myxococcota bacterium]
MAQVFVLHWKPDEALPFLELVRECGHSCTYEFHDGGQAFRKIKARPHHLIVISLAHKPSHGRETAKALLETKATRDIPVVFVDGDAAAVESVRKACPQARFIAFDGLRDILKSLPA